jgi:hypothetical protein
MTPANKDAVRLSMKDGDSTADGFHDGDVIESEVIDSDVATRDVTGGAAVAGTNAAAVPKGAPHIFREVQRLAEYRIWLPIALIAGATWYEFLRRIAFDDPTVPHSVPDWAVVILTVIFGVGTPLFGLLAMRLVTEVYPGLLTVRLTPFPRARLPMQVIKIAQIREYSALREYRGWGVKVNRRNGRAYTARGNKGVQMVLANESLLLIGTQQPKELMAALRSAGAELEETSDRGRKRAQKTGADTRR